MQPKTFRECVNEENINEIVLNSLELFAAEQLLTKHFSLIKIASFQKVKDTLITENDKTGLLQFAKTSTYFANKTNLQIDFLLSIPKPTILQKTEIGLLNKRMSKIEKNTSNPISLKDLHKEVNKRVPLEFQISMQYLSVLLDKFFTKEKYKPKEEPKEEPKFKSRKTLFIISKKQV